MTLNQGFSNNMKATFNRILSEENKNNADKLNKLDGNATLEIGKDLQDQLTAFSNPN